QTITCAILSTPKQTTTISATSPPLLFSRGVNLRRIVASKALPCVIILWLFRVGNAEAMKR
ncbi:hypothetical protein P692DRAFT_20740929, partial [Suillus brevipes Sb2]